MFRREKFSEQLFDGSASGHLIPGSGNLSEDLHSWDNITDIRDYKPLRKRDATWQILIVLAAAVVGGTLSAALYLCLKFCKGIICQSNEATTVSACRGTRQRTMVGVTNQSFQPVTDELPNTISGVVSDVDSPPSYDSVVSSDISIISGSTNESPKYFLGGQVGRVEHFTGNEDPSPPPSYESVVSYNS